MRQRIPVNHPVWYTECTVERMQFVTHSWSPLLCMAIRTTSTHLSSVARTEEGGGGGFFPICRANRSQKPVAEINKQYITNTSPRSEKRMFRQGLWLQHHTKAGGNGYIIYATRQTLLGRSEPRNMWWAVHIAHSEREVHADILSEKLRETFLITLKIQA